MNINLNSESVYGTCHTVLARRALVGQSTIIAGSSGMNVFQLRDWNPSILGYVADGEHEKCEEACFPRTCCHYCQAVMAYGHLPVHSIPSMFRMSVLLQDCLL